jgi:hypothetical protein
MKVRGRTENESKRQARQPNMTQVGACSTSRVHRVRSHIKRPHRQALTWVSLEVQPQPLNGSDTASRKWTAVGQLRPTFLMVLPPVASWQGCSGCGMKLKLKIGEGGWIHPLAHAVVTGEETERLGRVSRRAWGARRQWGKRRTPHQNRPQLRPQNPTQLDLSPCSLLLLLAGQACEGPE